MSEESVTVGVVEGRVHYIRPFTVSDPEGKHVSGYAIEIDPEVVPPHLRSDMNGLPSNILSEVSWLYTILRDLPDGQRIRLVVEKVMERVMEKGGAPENPPEPTVAQVQGCDVHGHTYPIGSHICAQCGDVRNPQTGRTPEQERMVRFGYYSNMAAELLSRLSKLRAGGVMGVLAEHDYPVVERLREMSEWCYSAGRNDITTGDDTADAEWNSVKVSYAIGQLRAAVRVLREQRFTRMADEIGRLADQVEAFQSMLNQPCPRCEGDGYLDESTLTNPVYCGCVAGAAAMRRDGVKSADPGLSPKPAPPSPTSAAKGWRLVGAPIGGWFFQCPGCYLLFPAVEASCEGHEPERLDRQRPPESVSQLLESALLVAREVLDRIDSQGCDEDSRQAEKGWKAIDAVLSDDPLAPQLERRMRITGWKMVDGVRQDFVNYSYSSPSMVAYERGRIGEEVEGWQPHITEVLVEERYVTPWRPTDA